MRREVVGWPPHKRRRVVATSALLALLATLAASCGLQASPATRRQPSGSPTVIAVAAAESSWGSIAEEIGGSMVKVTSIISRPDADPHSYEPTVGDARTVASADLVIVNGMGYDSWASKLLAADPAYPAGPVVVDVGDTLQLRAGANPHRWYNPNDVDRIVTALVGGLSRLRPARAGYFQARSAAFRDVALGPYRAVMTEIRQRYGGSEVGASESIFEMIAPDLGLRIITPVSFLEAITEGNDPSPSDVATIDRQIRTRAIAIYVVNSQNVTPDVKAQVAQCLSLHIPIATITETLSPASTSYEAWQTSQLQGILAALARSGRQ